MFDLKPIKIFIAISLFLNILLLGSVYFINNKVHTLTLELGYPDIVAPVQESIPINLATSTLPDAVVLNSSSTPTSTELEIDNSPKLFSLFTDLLQSVSFSNTSLQDKRIALTGDDVADDIVYALAEDLGYIRQPVATTTLSVVEGYRVQAEVASAWMRLKAAAYEEAGIRLGVVSGYRSPEAQRSLFLKYFREETKKDGRKEYTVKEIQEGKADKTLLRTLSYGAPPGYSRHHTGYTIDIRDIDSGLSFYEFGKTRGYKWIARNNYANARKFGFVPSYPRGERIDGGPEPEPWELVWIGNEKIEALDLGSI